MPNPNQLAKAPPSLIAALYLASGFLVIGPFLYEAQRLFPVKPNEVDWRFGASGFILSAATTPLLGLALANLLAYLRGYSRPRLLVALLTGAFAAVLVVVLLVFVLDLGGVVRTVPARTIPVVRATAISTILGASTAILASIVLTIGALAAAREPAGAPR